MKSTLLALTISHGLILSVQANEADIEETLVTGIRDSRIIQLENTVEVAPDSAQLLRTTAGANINSNGPITGIAQLRGMYGQRVGVQVNGQTISAGGPNWMDPPLSYAPAAQLSSIEVFRGIAPVSAGQETIGGAIHASTWSGEYADSNKLKLDGFARLGAQSVNASNLVTAAASIASKTLKSSAVIMSESGDNAEFPDGEISPTEYNRQRADFGLGGKIGSHQFQLDLTRNETGDAGTPSLPMDIESIDATLINLSYNLKSNDLGVKAKLYGSDIEHGMSNYHLRNTPMMGAMWRHNLATGESLGFALSATRQSWNVGIDYHSETHNSDITNPNNDNFFVTNFNNAERTTLGIFTELDHALTRSIKTEFGIRLNNVSMNADEVDGTPAQMNMMGNDMMMPPGATLRNNFNNADRVKTDHNMDLVAKLSSQANSTTKLYVGLAQKTRSPSYQERYLWLPLEATAGLADGRTYTGNIDLKPEVAREIELGIDVNQGPLQFTPRFFYRKVNDYIQGTPSSNQAAIMMVEMMGMNPHAPLEFNNVDAVFYGFDTDIQVNFSDRYSLDAIINIVHGKRDDIDDNLYRISPTNSTIGFNIDNTRWSLRSEASFFAAQNRISETQGEQTTPGYAIANAKAHWNISSNLRLGSGVDNLFDKKYQDHLAGYNRVMGSDIPQGSRLYGNGRNIYIRLDYKW